MKILLVHNFYGSSAPSGENEVFNTEKKLLKSNGNDVYVYTRNSDEIREAGLVGKLRGAFATPWNPFSAIHLSKIISDVKPDVVHVHNTFPLISPSIFRSANIVAPVVLTLHNYRLFCAAAIPMRDSRICTKCLDTKSVLPSITHGCYRNSRIATLPLAINISLNRSLKTWEKYVDAFITLSEFQKNLVIKAGLPDKLVHCKPNFFPGNPKIIPWSNRGDYAVFVGRLSPEKGVANLINAWMIWGKGRSNYELLETVVYAKNLNRYLFPIQVYLFAFLVVFLRRILWRKLAIPNY